MKYGEFETDDNAGQFPQRHPMDGLREIEDKDKIIEGLMQSIACQKQTHDAMIKRLMAQEDALKVADEFINACLKFGIADATGCIDFDEYANQTLEQIRKVVK